MPCTMVEIPEVEMRIEVVQAPQTAGHHQHELPWLPFPPLSNIGTLSGSTHTSLATLSSQEHWRDPDASYARQVPPQLAYDAQKGPYSQSRLIIVTFKLTRLHISYKVAASQNVGINCVSSHSTWLRCPIQGGLCCIITSGRELEVPTRFFAFHLTLDQSEARTRESLVNFRRSCSVDREISGLHSSLGCHI